MRKILFTLIFFASLAAMADRGGFKYTSWNVTAVVSAKNEWSILEQEDVFFYEPRHGIYRYIPMSFKAPLNSAPEGKSQQVYTKEYNANVHVIRATGSDFYIYEENGNTVVRMGSITEEVKGAQSYQIGFIYAYPNDRIKARDFLFHTIKPADINEEVDEFSFVITFEKPLPADIVSRLKIYTGTYGERKEAQMDELEVTPTKISGRILGIKPRQALTLYAELPEGFWELPPDTQATGQATHWAWIAIALGILIIGIELTRHEPTSVKVVEFYPPDDVTPSEVGTIIDNSVDIIDLTALVPWFAQQGYLTIKELKEKDMSKEDTDIELRKTSTPLPDDAPEYQKCIMAILFPYSRTVQHMKKLDPELVNNAKNALRKHFRGDRKLREYQVKYLLLIPIFFVCGSIAFISSPLLSNHGTDVLQSIIYAWVIPGIGAAFLRLSNSTMDDFRSKKKTRLIYGIRFLLFCVTCFFVTRFISDPDDNELPMWTVWLLLAVSYVVVELTGRLQVDTEYRASLRGRLQGFREFIETAEKDRLEMLLESDPKYFYKIFPYAIVFGLTDKLVKLFKDINIQRADWYIDDYSIDTYHYLNSLSQAINNNVDDAINSSSCDDRSSTDSGGFSDGGGFSGGGGGGGGGGSW